MNQITGSPLDGPLPQMPPMAPAAAGRQPQQPFRHLLLESIEHVNAMQQDADRAVQTLVTGGDVNPAEVLTAVQKADMTFRLMLQLRNKLLQAYQEVREIRI